MGAKTARPNREPLVVDVEGGVTSSRDEKAAREVIESSMNDRDLLRLVNRIIDEARDTDTSATRAARDRDRATPRDVSHVESARLRAGLPAPEEFRSILSARQRKLRSATKNRVLAAAPATQRRALQTMLGERAGRTDDKAPVQSTKSQRPVQVGMLGKRGRQLDPGQTRRYRHRLPRPVHRPEMPVAASHVGPDL